MELTIECQTRPSEAKPNALRRQGLIPAVLYGHNGTESVSLSLNAKEADLLVRKASINNTLITLKVPDMPWSGKALLREIHTHPAKGSLYHLSFFSIAAQTSLEVTVPLDFVGDAVGVTEGRGSLDTVLTELQVQCDSDHIPETIQIDVSPLKIGDMLHVKDLILPEGIKVMGEPDRIVVSVLPGSGGSDSAS